MESGVLLGGRFELEHQVGAGGMGKVFRAHDRASGGAVAVKIISDERGSHTERFRREIKVLAELSHPGIVRYVAHGETASGELFLAMEWLDGEDLKSYLARAMLSVSDAI